MIAVCKQRNLKGNCETQHKGKYGMFTEKENQTDKACESKYCLKTATRSLP